MSKPKKMNTAMSMKMRIMLVLGSAVVVVGAVIAYFSYSASSARSNASTIAYVTGIESIPGAGNPSDNYVSTQNKQNIDNAEKAVATGSSSVPTILRPSFSGSYSLLDVDTKDNNKSLLDNKALIAKACKLPSAGPKACTVDKIKASRRAGVNPSELRCLGCQCPVLRLAGYTAGELKSAGWDAKPLQSCGYSLKALKDAGFSAAELAEAGFSAEQLKNAGFSAAELKAAGFSAQDLLSAGFSPDQLSGAGFSAKDLKNAGLSAEQLRKAGFGAAELKAGGLSADELKAAGFTDKEIAAKDDVICSITNLKKERTKGTSALLLKNKGCSAAALRAAGYTAGELKQAGFSAKELKDAGFSASDLKNAGFSAAEIKAAGYTASQMKDAGFSAKELKALGFSANDLKGAGFSAKDLLSAGFSPADLAKVGFTAGELKAAGLSAKDLAKAGFTAGQLRAAGFNSSQLKSAGLKPSELRKAGYTDGDLIRAGYTPEQIGYNNGPGCSSADLLNARKKGVPATELLKKGCSAKALRAANYSAIDLKSAGANETDVSAAGYTKDDILQAGYIIPKSSYQAWVPNIGNSKAATQSSDHLSNLLHRANNQLADDEKAMLAQQLAISMTAQAQSFLNDWNQTSSGQQISENNLEMANQGKSNSGDGKESGTADTGKTIKAGTVMFGVLTTGINSDEKSPILAKIVTGPLKGSKLVGKFERVNKKVVLNFNLINSPQYNKSLPINVVAIDQDTARTAVSDSVNSHYMLRYGSLFAASFISGFADAMSTAGTSDLSIGSAIKFTSKPNNISTRGQVVAGLGKVGQQYSSIMGKNFNRAPTVKVPSGFALGLLFMTDVTLPAPDNVAGDSI